MACTMTPNQIGTTMRGKVKNSLFSCSLFLVSEYWKRGLYSKRNGKRRVFTLDDLHLKKSYIDMIEIGKIHCKNHWVGIKRSVFFPSWET